MYSICYTRVRHVLWNAHLFRKTRSILGNKPQFANLFCFPNSFDLANFFYSFSLSEYIQNQWEGRLCHLVIYFDVLENLQWNRAKIIVRKIAKLGATEVHLPYYTIGSYHFCSSILRPSSFLLNFESCPIQHVTRNCPATTY